MTTTNPVRFPDTSSREGMTRRGWWLVVLNFLIPGSAQLLAGNRRLGRFAVGATFTLWAVLLVAVILWFAARFVVLTIATNSIALTVAQVVLLFYGVLWVVLTLDTLRLVRLVRTAPVARGFIAGIAALVLVGLVSSAGYGVVVTGTARGLLGDVFSGTTIAPPVEGRYNILVLGGDAGEDRMGLRPDSISIMSIDAASGAATMIGIPRNLQRVTFAEDSPMHEVFPTGYDCGPECLVSYLYTYGEEHADLYPDALDNSSHAGIEAMRDAAESVTGLELQYYVLIDMAGFKNLIDALGGIDVVSPNRYPIGGSDGSDEPEAPPVDWIPKGEVHLSGYSALWYARARHGFTDYDRMQRQRQVQEAILAQAEPATILAKFQAVAQASSEAASTDIPQGMLPYFVELAGKAKSQPITSLNLVPEAGVNVIHPDFVSIHQMVQDALSSSTPTPDPQ
ncbi:LytR family transcriptional regulator [Glaciihabitans arcticus]|uniref:LytR family transcriptional regulator n=1 Tax=Glaciihabitans arcticus TaxID=2668039 RepID=A0A4Q9GMM2_9MICO|nr:LCP family protein [Glaciihabitans arcticus]TBN55936.1 LytR family transcriptional regulator [Glaciihabitans arcticus]